MSQTVRHGLPLLAAGQAQKEVTHNEAIMAIDRRLQAAVTTRSRSVPPSTPLAGDSYIVAIGASGAWSGRGDAIATFDGFGWQFTVPTVGSLAWIADEGLFAVFTGAWSSNGWPVASLKIGNRQVLGAAPVVLADPGGGSVIDTQARATIAQLIAALKQQGLLA